MNDIVIPSWVWPVLGAAIALFGLIYGRRKDRDEQVKERAVLHTNMVTLIQSVDGVRRDLSTALGGVDARLKDICEKQDKHGERLTRVEESAKQAHLRINEIKKEELS